MPITSGVILGAFVIAVVLIAVERIMVYYEHDQKYRRR